jgi:hypothetical protein
MLQKNGETLENCSKNLFFWSWTFDDDFNIYILLINEYIKKNILLMTIKRFIIVSEFLKTKVEEEKGKRI